MNPQKNQEVWLRGPLPGIIPTLQPVAHALLQAAEEIQNIMENFQQQKLWEKPAGAASVAFHLQHITGVLNRLFTYAEGNLLTPQQLIHLKSEGQFDIQITVQSLLTALDKQFANAIEVLKTKTENDLTLSRAVGRAQLPTTALGLYVHAAEHTMRHLGQLLVTVKVVTA